MPRAKNNRSNNPAAEFSVAPRQSKSLQKLRDAARASFLSEGFHKTRPQDIARIAGVATGTFYLHFVDKKAAFLDFAEQAQEELIALTRKVLQDSTSLLPDGVRYFGPSWSTGVKTRDYCRRLSSILSSSRQTTLKPGRSMTGLAHW